MSKILLLINLIPSAGEIMDYISENDADEKMLENWMWERMFKGRNWDDTVNDTVKLANLYTQEDCLGFAEWTQYCDYWYHPSQYKWYRKDDYEDYKTKTTQELFTLYLKNKTT